EKAFAVERAVCRPERRRNRAGCFDWRCLGGERTIAAFQHRGDPEQIRKEATGGSSPRYEAIGGRGEMKPSKWTSRPDCPCYFSPAHTGRSDWYMVHLV